MSIANHQSEVIKLLARRMQNDFTSDTLFIRDLVANPGLLTPTHDLRLWEIASTYLPHSGKHTREQARKHWNLLKKQDNYDYDQQTKQERINKTEKQTGVQLSLFDKE